MVIIYFIILLIRLFIHVTLIYIIFQVGYSWLSGIFFNIDIVSSDQMLWSTLMELPSANFIYPY